MQIAGYIGYAILIFFAFSWAWGVRRRNDLVLPTIMGSLFFSLATLALWIFGIDKIHSWWLLPAGFVFSLFCGLLMAFPLLLEAIRAIASIYAGLLRLGNREHA